jgi:hypothetical protein
VHNAYVFTIGADQADFGGTDLFVDARAGVALRRRVVRSAGYDCNPSVIAGKSPEK